jgi:hypothetical protein
MGTVTIRRFPAPWSVRELEQAFVVQDATGQAVAWSRKPIDLLCTVR